MHTKLSPFDERKDDSLFLSDEHIAQLFQVERY